jgi:Uma2 family endonuclease
MTEVKEHRQQLPEPVSDGLVRLLLVELPFPILRDRGILSASPHLPWALDMSATVTPPPKPAVPVHYPDDDGLPMSDNTQQMKWIFRLYGNLIGQYRDNAVVFVAANHLIYPLEGDNKTRQAPDVFVAFGRPKIERGSYRVWEESGIFPQVIFEVWSPGNRYADMQAKFTFYEKHGAEEYYILYPEFPAHAEGYRRQEGTLVRVEEIDGYASPRLGVRFSLARGELAVFDSGGHPMRTAAEIAADLDAAERLAREQQERAARLAAKLRELGVDPDAV